MGSETIDIRSKYILVYAIDKWRRYMISIIIPVYNVERYLSRCISSVLDLKTDFEIILINDGSTDDSGNMCNLWAEKDSRICVIHQDNRGLSVARNVGIQASTGEYIMFLDSDDFLDSNETEKMLLNINSKVEILMGLYRSYYEDRDYYENEHSDIFLTMHGKTRMDTFLKNIPADGRSCYMLAWRFIIKRKFLIDNKLFFLPGIYHEDEEWTQRLLCSSDSIFISHCYFYQYRRARGGSITSSVNSKHVWDSFRIMKCSEKLIKQQIANSPKEIYIRDRMAQLYLSNMLNMYVLPLRKWKEARILFEYFHGQCISRISGPGSNIVRLFDRFFGGWITCIIVGFTNKIRIRKRGK